GLATAPSRAGWAAPLGDSYTGAQTTVDQCSTAPETKWKRSNRLVMLPPRAMEGQGPEHSSGRIERFLELCANEHMIIANVSTPANFFHLLRRQLAHNFRKPL